MRKILFLVVICLTFFILLNIQGQKDPIFTSIQLAYNWFENNVNTSTGKLEYIYYPTTNTYSKSNNTIRQLVAMWSIAKAQKFLKTDKLNNVIKNTLDYYLKYPPDDLSYNACMILIFSEVDYPNKNSLLKSFADKILSRQQNDGSYLFNKETKEIEYSKGGIASGEVMLALMNMYSMTKDRRYLDSVSRGFMFYREYWRGNQYFFVQWQTQAYYQLYLATKNNNIVPFIFEMNDWIIDNALTNSEFTINNITIMEGTIDAYRLAKVINDKKHENKYKAIIDETINKTLLLQVNSNRAKKYKNPKRTLGGFFFSVEDSSQLIDSTFHPMNAMIKAHSLQ